ncbi:hypothetical protein OUZ56_029678 [Daphnia magna]|uniref:Uncharacterized protein n=1 Tax=Daphnia magna TaxID=35525 RepID=A0ABR0B7I5_9CRUS|nr:hypothetical protein OUZ56_029678 [Daphnia magna]
MEFGFAINSIGSKVDYGITIVTIRRPNQNSNDLGAGIKFFFKPMLSSNYSIERKLCYHKIL